MQWVMLTGSSYHSLWAEKLQLPRLYEARGTAGCSSRAEPVCVQDT